MPRKHNGDGSVYNSSPYHAMYESDDEAEDDDICVWKDRPELPEPIDFCPSDEENDLATRFGRTNIGSETPKTPKTPMAPKMPMAPKTSMAPKTPMTPMTPSSTATGSRGQPESARAPSSDFDPETGKLTKEAFREREVQHALATARRNLTHASQFLLKLEARAGKTTKEGIRQTLDATVRDLHYDFNACGSDGGPPDADHKGEIEELNHLSKELYNRIYLIDRHWRAIARENRDAQGKSPDIAIMSEGGIKEWIKVEIQTNHLTIRDTCFYTARDLEANRSLYEWAMDLQEVCKFGDHPGDQFKLVQLAWRFLDRNLRGPRPLNPTSLEKFISDLEAMRASGAWDEIRKNPDKGEKDDAEAWAAMKNYWSSRVAPM
ncbi:hypothetical protein F5Y14DRAFT_399342 [Nemania sp. NC0429]|nr:hypothetical protein F5Y14DRAFT_399342 [Nemania sp. NC0429]